MTEIHPAATGGGGRDLSEPEETEEQLNARLRLIDERLHRRERLLWEQRRAARLAAERSGPPASTAPAVPAAPEPPVAASPASRAPRERAPAPGLPAPVLPPPEAPAAVETPAAREPEIEPAPQKSPRHASRRQSHLQARPWERRPGESPKAFAAFECYRGLPPRERSLQRAWEMHRNRPEGPQAGKRAGKPYGHWTRWMQQWGWYERAQAWDEEMAARVREEEAARAQEARKVEREEDARQRRLVRGAGQTASAVAAGYLLHLQERLEKGGLGEMSLLALLSQAPKMGSLLRTSQHVRLHAAEEAPENTERRAFIAQVQKIMKNFLGEGHWREFADALEAIDDEE